MLAVIVLAADPSGSSGLLNGDGGFIGVVVVALLGVIGVYLNVRRAGKDSNSSERTELLTRYREERDRAETERDEATALVRNLQQLLLDEQGKRQAVEYDAQRSRDRIAELSGEVRQLREAVTAQLPPDDSEDTHD